MRSSNMRRCVFMVLTSAAAFAAGGDYGNIGPTYAVREADMLAWIEQKVADKVASGEAQRLQQERSTLIQRKLENPAPLLSVSKATKNRTLYYDPTYTAADSIADDRGQILVAAGTTVNPLDRVSLSRPLVFFDGRDPSQVAFAKRFIDRREGLAKPILVGGSYFDLMKEWQAPVYFDQQSALIRKLGIRFVPAIVVQEGKRLRIDEIAL